MLKRIVLEKVELVHRDELLSITVITVALSALLHGLSAAPLARLYGRYAESMGECEENMPVPEIPLRDGLMVEIEKTEYLEDEEGISREVG